MKGSRYYLTKNKYLLSPEVEKLNQILKTFYHSNPRDVLIIELALNTGARAQEILNLTEGDLNFYDQSIFIHGIKNSNDREIPLKMDLFHRLTQYLEIWKKKENFISCKNYKIFPISYDRLLQIWHFYRPIPKNFHSLRHTFAIQLYQKTKDIRLVQVALGHRNISNTMIYAEYVYSQTELRKLIID